MSTKCLETNSKEKKLSDEKHELIERMEKKIEILREDQSDVVKELSENKTELERIVSEVREIGGLADADKLVTHIKELESLTKLMTVLSVRLKITESKLMMIKDETEKVFKDFF